jgi:SlyX protein
MTDEMPLAARIDALEIRSVYQEEAIEALNKTITAQWTQLDGLKRELAELRERLADAENRTGIAPSSEPPPHY